VDDKAPPANGPPGLALYLRFLGALDISAFFAVIMPWRWMAFGHTVAGLGEMPHTPIVGYLARSASVMYAIHGAIFLFMSFDVPRYIRLITFLAVVALFHGAIMLGIDLVEGMPPVWTAFEGLGFAATGGAVLVLLWLDSTSQTKP
jgi:hypothetical protein